MVKNIVIIVLLALFALPVVMAGPGTVTVPSANGFSDTVSRFKSALDSKGIKLTLEVNHQGNAASVDEELGKTRLLIFGNPKLGTPLMRDARTIGVDLPMKVLIWEDADGKTFLTYNAPKFLAERHGISGNDSILNKMSGALNILSATAAQAPW